MSTRKSLVPNTSTVSRWPLGLALLVLSRRTDFWSLPDRRVVLPPPWLPEAHRRGVGIERMNRLNLFLQPSRVSQSIHLLVSCPSNRTSRISWWTTRKREREGERVAAYFVHDWSLISLTETGRGTRQPECIHFFQTGESTTRWHPIQIK